MFPTDRSTGTFLCYSHGSKLRIIQILQVDHIFSSAVSFSLKQLSVLTQLQAIQPRLNIFLQQEDNRMAVTAGENVLYKIGFELYVNLESPWPPFATQP